MSYGDAASNYPRASNNRFGMAMCDGTSVMCPDGILRTTPGNVSAGNPTAVAGPAAVNGSAATFMRSDAAPAVQYGTNHQAGLLQADGVTTTVNTIGIISAVSAPLSTNAALKALVGQPPGTIIYRAGFYAAGDGGGAYYVYSTAPCSLNAGAGDNGAQIPAAAGAGCWNIVASTGYDVRIWGAVGNGTADDTPSIQAGVNWVSSAGGVLVASPGHYCVKTGPINVTAPGVTIQGANEFSVSQFTACGADVTIFSMTGYKDVLRYIEVDGSNHVSTTKPAVHLSGGCGECLLQFVYIIWGSNGVYVDHTTDAAYILNSDIALNYASSVSVAVANAFVIRSRFDQAYPYATPTLPTAITVWAATHAYTAGALVTNSAGYLLQAMTAGTSGTVNPVQAEYGTAITDGTVSWKMTAPPLYYGIVFDGNSCAMCLVSDSDFSSPYRVGIRVQNTLGDGPPQLGTFSRNTLSYNTEANIYMDAGHGFQVVDNILGGCVDVGCSNISVPAGFIGDLIISGNQIYAAGGVGSGSISTGIFVGAGSETTISNNAISRAQTAISIGPNISSFNIVGNTVGGSGTYGSNGSGIFVASGTGDFFTIMGNNCSGVTGTGIQVLATGANKTVLNGACP